MLAAQNGHAFTVAALLRAHADVGAVDVDGTCALMFAARNGHTRAVQALLGDLSQKADVNQAKRSGFTALMYADTVILRLYAL